MNRYLYSASVRNNMRRHFSAKTRANSLRTLTQPLAINSFAGLSPAWRPFGPIADEILGSRFTDEFDDATMKRFSRIADEAPMDCKESLKDFQIQINLPGLQKQDIHLDVQDRILTVSAEMKGMSKNEGDNFRRVERFRGHVMRSLSLPHGVDENAVSASYTDGVLHVTLPKQTEEELPKAKSIQIE